MAFRLKKNEGASAGVRRIAREAIDEAIEVLEDRKAEPAETVHELRKQLKKIRAIIRLVRDELGEKVYRRENRALRDLGRRLSAARDAAVRVSALDLLREKKDGGRLAADEVAPIRKRLAARRREAVRRVRRSAALPAIERELRNLRRRVRAWPLGKAGFSCLEPGLRRAYRDGRRAEVEAYAARTDEAFHEWRKRAKDLRYHVALLEPAWPDVMKDVEQALHDLTDRLGDDHDLADLRRVLNGSSALTKGSDGVARVFDRIAHRRSVLQADARPIAARIYSEKPKAFSARIAAYWDAWRS
jgi:CHAD domain-containing protein